MLLLNLGCGELPIQGAVNVDRYKGAHVDETADLMKFPWKWQDNSVDGIYCIHVLEHFVDMKAIINECHRILKKGGFLYLEVPHASSVVGIGRMDHHHTVSWNTFSDEFSKKFSTETQEIRWWAYPRNKKHPYVRFAVHAKDSIWHPVMFVLLINPLRYVIQSLINVSPRAFERLWCFWVGGADELVWKGIKV
jgi:SAM-dependent methyltransferase